MKKTYTYKEQGKTRIGVDVTQDTLKKVDTLCKKERWSRKTVGEVALEYYLKLRGIK
jgi:metal-responsive CopG/Arc/MetJ family transcriptional regulator